MIVSYSFLPLFFPIFSIHFLVIMSFHPSFFSSPFFHPWSFHFFCPPFILSLFLFYVLFFLPSCSFQTYKLLRALFPSLRNLVIFCPDSSSNQSLVKAVYRNQSPERTLGLTLERSISETVVYCIKSDGLKYDAFLWEKYYCCL